MFRGSRVVAAVRLDRVVAIVLLDWFELLLLLLTLELFMMLAFTVDLAGEAVGPWGRSGLQLDLAVVR